MGDPGRDRSSSRRTVTAFELAAFLAATLTLLGALCTDQWYWSQFVWWIPWPLLVLLAMPAALTAIIARSRATRNRLGLLAVALVPAVALLVRDVGFHRAPPPADDEISFVHWNASWPSSSGGSDGSRELLDRKADVIILSNPYKLFADQRDEQWRRAGYDIVVTGSFAVASRIPVLEAREIFDSDVGTAAIIRIDTRGRIGHVLTVLAVDLPSEPMLARMELAHAFRARLEEHTLPRIDVITGDCNMTKGSASLQAMFPSFRNAWNEAGSGIAGSWPRSKPFGRLLMWHIDQLLLGHRVTARSYRIIDLGGREHRAQQARIAAR